MGSESEAPGELPHRAEQHIVEETVLHAGLHRGPPAGPFISALLSTP